MAIQQLITKILLLQYGNLFCNSSTDKSLAKNKILFYLYMFVKITTLFFRFSN